MVGCAITPSSVTGTYADLDRREQGELAPRLTRCLRGWRTITFGLVAVWLSFANVAPAVTNASAGAANYSPTLAETQLLDDLQRRAVLFFLEHTDPRTGLTEDRAPNDGSAGRAPASVAATGFALSAWCIADSRGWLPAGEARRRVRLTLEFAADHLAQERGWFYHFVDAKTGRRAWRSEASTIDTALFLQGALMAREYLRDEATSALVDRIYRRIDWTWALNGGHMLSHGWRPETGFIPHRWDNYSEHMGLYLLGIGAPQRALPASAWGAWRREPVVELAGRTFLQCGPLFTHQYAQAWFDFRGRHDGRVDYWQNSIDATLAQRAWSAAQSARFPTWSSEMWGLSAGDGARGYTAWGTPGPDRDISDGTLVPCAPAGSLPFAPRECLAVLMRMRESGRAGVWGRYGFTDAFNPETGWVSPDVIGIDQGISLVMAENLRSGLVWENFMRAPEVRRGMELAGFRSRDETNERPMAKIDEVPIAEAVASGTDEG